MSASQAGGKREIKSAVTCGSVMSKEKKIDIWLSGYYM
jgi:hypothetical protein